MVITNKKEIRLLWMSPVLNHYKARFLNHLSKNSNIKLTVIAGSGRKNMGDIDETGKMKYRIIRSDISKDDFGKSRDIRKLLKKSRRRISPTNLLNSSN